VVAVVVTALVALFLLATLAVVGLLATGAVLLAALAFQALRRPAPAISVGWPAAMGVASQRSAGARLGAGAPVQLATRYARGDLSEAEFKRQLVEVLKDRYIRGEIGVQEYEASLRRVLRDLPAS
jgi:hypothetical protein